MSTFRAFFVPFEHRLTNRLGALLAQTTIELTQGAKQKVVSDILACLFEKSQQVLMADYESCLAQGKNQPWRDQTKTQDLARLYRDYPVLERLLDDQLTLYESKLAEIICLIADNQRAIADFLSMDRETHLIIETLACFEGDCHEETIVAKLEVGGNTIMIKQRPTLGERILLALEPLFGPFQPRTQVIAVDLILQDYVNHQDISVMQMPGYYERFGELTALVVALGAKDIHSANIIATDQGPLLVDVEVPVTSQQSSCSLLKASMLFNISEKRLVYGDDDFSAFSGKPFTYEQPVIKHVLGRLVWDKQEMTYQVKNLPRVDCNPFDYGTDVIQGFKRMSTNLLANKASLYALLKAEMSYKYRVVLRNTAFYARYNQILAGPQCLSSAERYQEVLELLEQKSKHSQAVIRREQAGLAKGLVPYFTSEFLGETSDNVKKAFLRRIERLDAAFFDRERYYLHMSLPNTQPQQQGIGNDSSQGRVKQVIKQFLQLAKQGDRLHYGALDLSVQDRLLDNRNDFYMFGLTYLFLYQIQDKLRPILQQTLALGRVNKGGSGFIGYPAALLLRYLMGQELDFDPERLRGDVGEQADFSNLGSGILILDYLAKVTDNQAIIASNERLGRLYLEASQDQTLTGLVHGYAGDSLVYQALQKLGLATDDQILALLEKENGYFDASQGWLDTRQGQIRQLHALSYGTSGVVLSRMVLYGQTDHPVIKKIAQSDIDRGVRCLLTKKRTDFADDTLINGYAGALLVLQAIRQTNIVADEDLLVHIDAYLDLARTTLASTNWRMQGLAVESPCFANGSMGIAYVLWMLTYNKPWYALLGLSF